MTIQKQFKKLVRERMKKTGESYTSCSPSIAQTTPPIPRLAGTSPAAFPRPRPARFARGRRCARSAYEAPFSEAMLFGIAGASAWRGGVSAMRRRISRPSSSPADICGSTICLLQECNSAIGLKAIVKETAARNPPMRLRAALENGPVIAWVDMAHCRIERCQGLQRQRVSRRSDLRLTMSRNPRSSAI